MTFTGIPHEAADFYARLEEDNSRDFWTAHKETYESQVRGPMAALMDALEDDFGPAKLFRPNRDVRFAKDKAPYKTHQGGFVELTTRTGWYAEVSADGFRVGGGTYHLDPLALAAYRAAVDSPWGIELERIVEELRADGWEVTGETLKTAPRGIPRDHPRIALLRHTSLAAMRWIEDADVVTTPRLVAEVRARWEATRPLLEWLDRALPRS